MCTTTAFPSATFARILQAVRRPALFHVLVLLLLAPSHLAAQEILRPGDPSLRLEHLRTGTDSTRVWRHSGDQRQKGPLQIQQVERVFEGGEERLQVAFTLESERGDLHDTTTFRLPSLAPATHRSRPGPDGAWRSLEIAYGDNAITGTITPPDSASHGFEVPVSEDVFDPGIGNLLFSILPFAPDYEVRVPVFNHESRQVELHAYRVVGEGVTEFRGASVDVWHVEVSLPSGQTFRATIDKATGRTVRGVTELGPDMRVVTLPAGS